MARIESGSFEWQPGPQSVEPFDEPLVGAYGLEQPDGFVVQAPEILEQIIYAATYRRRYDDPPRLANGVAYTTFHRSAKVMRQSEFAGEGFMTRWCRGHQRAINDYLCFSHLDAAAFTGLSLIRRAIRLQGEYQLIKPLDWVAYFWGADDKLGVIFSKSADLDRLDGCLGVENPDDSVNTFDMQDGADHDADLRPSVLIGEFYPGLMRRLGATLVEAQNSIMEPMTAVRAGEPAPVNIWLARAHTRSPDPHAAPAGRTGPTITDALSHLLFDRRPPAA